VAPGSGASTGCAPPRPQRIRLRRADHPPGSS
jgi:hypothetical protein